ncbi:MAG: UTP--glucose-1-phosphate uridylyltransferase GalU [Candidatus Hydrothermarchaeaceae archaeon]
MKAVIPAAGLGTRFLPATKAQPKEMLPVYDKPTIQYVVEEAVESGIDDILIITGRGKRAIEDHFDRAVELELALRHKNKDKSIKELKDISDLANLHFVRQKEQKGLGDAVLCAKKFVGGEPFAVLLGDTITMAREPCTKQLMMVHKRYKGSVIAVEKVRAEKIPSYGIIEARPIDSIYEILKLVEKPKPEDAPSDLGIIGRYVLTPEIFDFIEEVKPGVGDEIQLTDALKALGKKQPLYAYVFDGRRYDIGTKLDWLKSSIEIALENPGIKDELRSYLGGLLERELS